MALHEQYQPLLKSISMPN